MLIRSFLLVLMIIFMSACSSIDTRIVNPVTIKEIDFKNITPWHNLSTSYKKSWTNVLNFLTEKGWVTMSASKDGGVISTDWKMINRGEVYVWIFEEDKAKYEYYPFQEYDTSSKKVLRTSVVMRRSDNLHFAYGDSAKNDFDSSSNYHCVKTPSSGSAEFGFIHYYELIENTCTPFSPKDDAIFKFDASNNYARPAKARMQIYLKKTKGNKTRIRIVGYVNTSYNYGCFDAPHDLMVGRYPVLYNSSFWHLDNKNCKRLGRSVFRVSDESVFVRSILSKLGAL